MGSAAKGIGWIFSLCFLFLFLLGGRVFAAYPPVPGDSFYAEDYAGILTGGDRNRINAMGRALEQETGAQVVVAAVKRVPDGDMESYANGFFRERKLGDKSKNNGILLLVSMEDRRARIEVGYGLEGALNDAKAGRLLDQYLIPAFQEGQYSQGVAAAYAALIQVVMREYKIDKLSLDQGGTVAAPAPGGNWMDFLMSWEGLALLAVLIAAAAADMVFFGGAMTQSLLQFLFFFLMSRGGGGGGFGGRGRGGSSGGGGAGRGW